MKISILTPSFNSGRYLERAIQSVLVQNDPDFEHIIVDGGSKDDTITILKKYQHLTWVSEPDSGQCDAMNKAFARSSGDVVVYLNADDWFEPGVFAHIRDCFISKPETDMVIGNFYVRHLNDTAVHLRIPVKEYRRTLLFFRFVWPLNPISYFYRRYIQESVGVFQVGEPYMDSGMDYWFLIRAMSKAGIHASDLVFGTYFIPPESKTSQNSDAIGIKRGLRQFRVWVLQHLRQTNPKLIPWFHTQWYFHYCIRKLPSNIKFVMRYIVYKPLFSKIMDYEEYKTLGYRRAWKKRFSVR